MDCQEVLDDQIPKKCDRKQFIDFMRKYHPDRRANNRRDNKLICKDENIINVQYNRSAYCNPDETHQTNFLNSIKERENEDKILKSIKENYNKTEAKPTEAKPTEAKPTEGKPTEAKPTEAKRVVVDPVNITFSNEWTEQPKVYENKNSTNTFVNPHSQFDTLGTNTQPNKLFAQRLKQKYRTVNNQKNNKKPPSANFVTQTSIKSIFDEKINEAQNLIGELPWRVSTPSGKGILRNMNDITYEGDSVCIKTNNVNSCFDEGQVNDIKFYKNGSSLSNWWWKKFGKGGKTKKNKKSRNLKKTRIKKSLASRKKKLNY